jgi:hypothetical protein
MKCGITPVRTGAMGIVTKGVKEYSGAIPGRQSIDLLQQTVIPGTSRIIKKVLQSET